MKRIIFLLLISACATTLADVSVTSVEAQQRYPWNGLVDIVVTLECQADDIGKVECSFVATNSATLAAVPVTSITQKGSDAGSGTTWTRRFLWDAASDVGGVKIDDLALTVDAEIELGGVQLWENGPYWAECNVGATKPEEYGYYFWWGDTVGYTRSGGTWTISCYYSGVTWVSSTGVRMNSSPFSSSTCPTYDKNNSQLESAGYIDATGNLVAARDAAIAHLGAPWRMPTDAEFSALISNCDTTWTTRGGVEGRLVAGRGAFVSKSIFLPAAGYGDNSDLNSSGSYGGYWSSTPYSDISYYADFLFLHSWGYFHRLEHNRFYGQSVRPVRESVEMMASCATTYLKLDCRAGARACTEGAETLYYDAGWYENATCVAVYDGNSKIAEGASGSVAWQPDTDSAHELKLVAYSAGETIVGLTSVTRSFTHVGVVTTAAKAATCTEVGCTQGSKCSRCNAVLSTSQTIAALGHAEQITTTARESTCAEAGCTKGSYCSRCNAVLSTSSVLPALGHVEQVTTAAREATCTEAGCTKGSYCSRCNAVLSTSSVLSALGHAEQITTVAKAATCTESGCTKGSYCNRCNAVLSTSQTIAALGHSGMVTKAAVEPTSAAAGSMAEIRCSRCGLLIQAATPIPALGYIRNVTARQLWPYHKIEVCYEIADDVADVLEVGQVLTLTCSYGTSAIDAKTLIGDITSTPGFHRVIWDAWSDGLVINSTDVTFCISNEVKTPGFITKTFHTSSLAFDKTSDVWSGAPSVVSSPDKLYATSLPEHTTVAYGCYMRLAKGSHYFEGCYDDFVGVKIGSEWILENTTECKKATRSYYAPETGYYKVEFRVGNNGGVGGCQNSNQFGVRWLPVGDDTLRKIGNTDSRTVFFSSVSGVGDDAVSGVSEPLSVNTSSAVVDGMSVSGSIDIAYSPVDANEVIVRIDGATVFSSTNAGTFTWQPKTKGTHTITHIAGTNVWTRTVNVTSLVYEEPTPNPPTAVDANFKLSTTVRALTSSAKASGTIGTAKEDPSYTGTWTATTSADWLTLTYATRNVGLPVVYTAAENVGVEDRTGYIYVSGHVFTVTQPGLGGSLDSEAAEFDANGGAGSFTVTVGAQASWRAMSNVDWISVETVCGTGETEVVCHVAPWNNVSTRSGTVTAAGCTFTVNQTGRPMKLNETKVTKDYLAHDIVLTVDALASTDWGIALDAPWVSIVDRGSGNGGGTVTLAINENPSYVSRMATALIGTETLTIVQTGRPTAALAFAISPEATTASVKGANGVIAVEATPDLPWTATSQSNWLTIMPGFSSAAGNGNVVYAATPNPTMAERSGTIRVTPDSATGLAGKTHSVIQPAATSMISVEAHTFAVDGDSFAVEVTVDDVVAWTIVENVDWLSVDGALSRNGSGSVTIAVDPNMSIEPREATLTIAGHEFHVVQRGRTITLEYGETVFAPESYEEATIEVHPNGEVAWTATPSDATWISVWSEDANVSYNADGSVSGIGDATLKYMVTAYVGDGGVKTGWIQIGNEKVYVAQRAYDLSIDPTGVAVSGNAGSGSVAVPATSEQVWNAVATEPWIKLVGNYDEVTGNGTVNYTFTDNDTGETRTGKIVIAGEEYTITQAARQLVTITATVMGEGCIEVEKVGGGGQRCEYSFDRGTAVDLTAVALNGWRFVRWEKGGVAVGDGTPTLPVTADVDQEIVAVFERIPVYTVNGESVVEGTIKSFTAPEPVVLGGTTQLVCRGTSTYPNKGTSFQLQITEDVNFEWDLWQTNYWIAINQTTGGTVSGAAGVRALPGWVEAGSEVSFTAAPAAGYSLMRWTVVDATSSSRQEEVVSSFVRRDGDVASTACVRIVSPLTVGAVFGIFNDTLAAATDAPSLAFLTGGDAAWTPAIDATAGTGYTSVRSGAIGPESESWLETTVSGGGTLVFRWRTDCEHDDGGDATWDRLAVFVNGVEKARLDGTADWQTVELPLTEAKSVIRWSFYRDDHDEPVPHFANCGWIDSVEVVK